MPLSIVSAVHNEAYIRLDKSIHTKQHKKLSFVPRYKLTSFATCAGLPMAKVTRLVSLASSVGIVPDSRLDEMPKDCSADNCPSSGAMVPTRTLESVFSQYAG